MAVTLTITTYDSELGPQRDGAGRVREKIKIVSAASGAGDTGTFTPTFVHRNAIIPGGVFSVAESVTLAGDALTITAIPALGTNTTYAEIIGDF